MREAGETPGKLQSQGRYCKHNLEAERTRRHQLAQPFHVGELQQGEETVSQGHLNGWGHMWN